MNTSKQLINRLTTFVSKRRAEELVEINNRDDYEWTYVAVPTAKLSTGYDRDLYVVAIFTEDGELVGTL